MSRSKKTKKTTADLVLSSDEQRTLDDLLSDLSQVEPSRLVEQAQGPHVAEALVERLPLTDPQTPRILLGLRSFFREKSVQKAIKKAAFRLRQKGIVLPKEQDSATLVLQAGNKGERDTCAYLGPIDGTGSRPVFISVPQRPAGVDAAIGVVNDEEGIIEFAFTRHSRKRMKEIKEIFFSKLPNMVETTLSHVADVLERAYQAKGPRVRESAGAYLQFRPRLREHTSGVERPVVYDFLPPETISHDLLTEPRLQSLFRHDLMGSWIIDLKSLRPLIEEINKAKESRIFISEGQRLEHIQRIKYQGTTKLLSEAKRLCLKYRLEEMAYVFFKSAEEGLARVCLAAASALAEKESPLRVNPFLTLLVERSLAYYLKSSKSSEQPADRQSQKLIIT